jgi:hypothetical protein
VFTLDAEECEGVASALSPDDTWGADLRDAAAYLRRANSPEGES